MGTYHCTVIGHISKPISHACCSQSNIYQSSKMSACTHHCTALFQNSNPSNWAKEMYPDPSPMFHHQRVEYSRSMYCSQEQTAPDWATWCPLINRNRKSPSNDFDLDNWNVEIRRRSMRSPPPKNAPCVDKKRSRSIRYAHSSSQPMVITDVEGKRSRTPGT